LDTSAYTQAGEFIGVLVVKGSLKVERDSCTQRSFRQFRTVQR